MKDLLYKIGVACVVIGFGVFISLYVITPYVITSSLIEETVATEAQSTIIKDELKDIIAVPTSNFDLQAKLSTAFALVNESIIDTYAITEIEVNQLVDLSVNGQLNPDHIVGLFQGPYASQKDEWFTAYGSWLFERDFTDANEANETINGVVSNISAYEIIPKLGIDKYKAKSYRYALAKGAVTGPVIYTNSLALFLSFGLAAIGGLLISLNYLKYPPGIKNDGIFNSNIKNRGWLGILLGTFLILFYIILYFFPQYIVPWVALVDPISMLIKGSGAGEFFLYGFMYTIAVLVMGVRMILKYRGNSYQLVRTSSVMFFQLVFAFLIPEILIRLNQPYFDFKNIWPLDYDFFFDFELANMLQAGSFGIFLLGWGIALIIIAVPVFTFFYGKRWYCSWVCGCGGLAETLGDPFRQLSNKSLKAWKVERYTVHGVLVFAVVMTIGVLYTYFTGDAQLFGVNTYSMREVYGAFIGAGFAGVIGTGFYPLMGNRMWCRFGCPLAAYLGIIQRFRSRFRITTNGGQCISCGNCSTYCEMGIDVRAYAQKGENIVRASCVGCGVCSSVCPRGVLKLENASPDSRFISNQFIK